jgi:hypothetical protein
MTSKDHMVIVTPCVSKIWWNLLLVFLGKNMLISTKVSAQPVATSLLEPDSRTKRHSVV